MISYRLCWRMRPTKASAAVTPGHIRRAPAPTPPVGKNLHRNIGTAAAPDAYSRGGPAPSGSWRPSQLVHRASYSARFAPLLSQDPDCADAGSSLLWKHGLSTAALRHPARRDGLPQIDTEMLHLQLPAAQCHTTLRSAPRRPASLRLPEPAAEHVQAEHQQQRISAGGTSMMSLRHAAGKVDKVADCYYRAASACWNGTARCELVHLVHATAED